MWKIRVIRKNGFGKVVSCKVDKFENGTIAQEYWNWFKRNWKKRVRPLDKIEIHNDYRIEAELLNREIVYEHKTLEMVEYI